MLFVNVEDCSGCGACLEACEFEAILLQNDKAFIDQERCQECQDCMETCPTGAIICMEEAPQPKTIQIAAEPAPMEVLREHSPASGPIRSVVLPMLGSVLLWTGRELVPRLADLALKTLDQRILSADQSTQRKNQPNLVLQERRNAPPEGGRRRRLRQRRNWRMKRF